MHPALDHIAIACTDLDAGAAWLSERLGVIPEPGGRHDFMGTHNRLLSLGPDEYLELIAIDPDATGPDRPRWFGLDGLSGPPRVVGWVVRAPYTTPAPPGSRWEAARRGDLEWRITIADSGTTGAGGTVPALIDWGDSALPSTRLPDAGLRLGLLRISQPAPVPLPVTDARVEVTTGPTALSARIDTHRGPVWL